VSDGYTIVGRIRKPHGIHGEFVVETICDEPDAIFAPGRRIFVGDTLGAIRDTGPEPVALLRARPFKGGLLVTLGGIADRNAAELWRNRYLFIPSEEVRPPAEGEVWLHEIAGMTVVDVSGATLGDVQDVQAVPQGYLLDVATARGIVSVPFVDAIVKRVDRDARTITIDPPAGLMDL
jgi:16S rRNA processing protein RimM